jgi:hypothetical protein
MTVDPSSYAVSRFAVELERPEFRTSLKSPGTPPQ